MGVMNIEPLWQIMEALRGANQLEDALAENLLSGNIKAGQTVVCTMKAGNVTFYSEEEEDVGDKRSDHSRRE